MDSQWIPKDFVWDSQWIPNISQHVSFFFPWPRFIAQAMMTHLRFSTSSEWTALGGSEDAATYLKEVDTQALDLCESGFALKICHEDLEHS